MEFLVLFLVLALAFANGANDVPKGVATLAGAGVAKVRTALIWGTVTTAIGCLISLHFAGKMTALFSKGIVAAEPTPAFAAAVLIGTVAWIAVATIYKLPVSTTHALVGSLLGAGAVFASSAVQWNSLVAKVVQPLLISIAVAYGVSLALTYLSRFLTAKVAVRKVTTSAPADDRGGVLVGTGATATETVTAKPEQQTASRLGALGVAHWITSGLTSLARGMNDTPKIVAIGSFALVSGMSTTSLAIGVTAAMAVGGLLVGSRIADKMANDVVKLTHVGGFTANLTTAALVGLGASQGLPMSTTHVSTGAITASAGAGLSHVKGKTLRDFALAWIVTPPFAAAVAAGAYLLLG
ncbi:inorganic phosphate transporter [Streptomyces ochraceiscleroticus]|uniref:Anion permease n=1 Tax=Streptomyces ochraceiscleroticus TaxID=47761 RepID=A0ABW1ML06_9ACTN|nr:inorganic phosphate transporter [Streptomyces ochraceiscleroticus]